MEVTEHNLKTQLENALKEQEAAQHKASTAASGTTENALLEAKSAINLKSKDLEEKKRELVHYSFDSSYVLYFEWNVGVFFLIIPTSQELLDNKVQALDKEWSVVEEESLKKPTPGTLDFSACQYFH